MPPLEFSPRMNTVHRATHLEQLIDEAMVKDGGGMFRELSKKYMLLLDDAFRGEEAERRFHFGISSIGEKCRRSLWLNWRWASRSKFDGRTLRLFNRGHLEEARFLAMLEMVGVHIEPAEDGGQHQVSDGGHIGTSLDALLYNVPEAPAEWCVGEFKTHNDKSFKGLLSTGVQLAKPMHYSQMQAMMKLRGVYKCLYMGVNKNDDAIYCEIVFYAPVFADNLLTMASEIVVQKDAPKRISNDPSFFSCVYCNHKQRCHFPTEEVDRNCRTCAHSEATLDGVWHCHRLRIELTKDMQLSGCHEHSPIPDLQRR